MSDFDVTLERYRNRCQTALEARLPAANATPERLHQAMRYSCLVGGKRLRAVLVYGSGEACGAGLHCLDGIAAAVEMIHAFSLVHDDLPAMDDDDLRRGQPTCHRAYDDATAILAGDALQTLAFELLASDDRISVPASRRLEMVAVLARATGAAGMAGGQSLDMQATDQVISRDALQQLHEMKTGALIRSSCVLGGLAASGTGDTTLQALDEYGAALGLLFQVTDDILDVTQNSEMLGKPSGADVRMQKSTYVSLLGLDGARTECTKLHGQALESARRLGDNQVLFRELADYVANRSY